MPCCADTAEGVLLTVRVIPRAGRTEIAGLRAGALLVRLAAPPVDGAANEALVAFLAERLRVPRRALRLASGELARQKKVAIAGVTASTVRTALGF